MDEDKLDRKPIPETIILGNTPTNVSYRTQEVECHSCHKKGHEANDCPGQEDFPVLRRGPVRTDNLNCFLGGVLPRGPDRGYRSKITDDGVRDVIDHLAKQNV